MDFDAIGWDVHRRVIDPVIEIDPIFESVPDEARASRPDVPAEPQRPAYVTTPRLVPQVRRTRGSMTL